MITVDIAVFFAVLFTMVLALAWFLTLPEWRRLGAARDLEMQEFFRRQGAETPEAAIGMPMARLAEVRCAACGAAAECAHRLAAGGTRPVEHCPNAVIFSRQK